MGIISVQNLLWRRCVPFSFMEAVRVIIKQLEEKEPLPDKEKDPMAWVRTYNQHKSVAEEIILKELIYV